jgi:hypothetical protein
MKPALLAPAASLPGAMSAGANRNSFCLKVEIEPQCHFPVFLPNLHIPMIF